MRSDQMYYAAFSAALMAGAEPGLAQRLAYQLAFLVCSPPELPADEAPKAAPAISAAADIIHCTCKVRMRPINPLSHVDWLNGGALNERGALLGRLEHAVRCSPGHGEPKVINPAPEPKEEAEDKFTRKLNRAILLAMTHADNTAMSKFVAALYCYLEKDTSLPTDKPRHQYWLLMHAIRCYLFGTTFRWHPDYAESTDARQQHKPMYPTILALCSHFEARASEPELCETLCEQLSYFPLAQQALCLPLGLAFRAEIMNECNFASAPHQTWLHFPDLADALIWLSQP